MKRDILLGIGVLVIALLSYVLGVRHAGDHFQSKLEYIKKTYPAKVAIYRSHSLVVETAVFLEVLENIGNGEQPDRYINNIKSKGLHELETYHRNLENPYLESEVRKIYESSKDDMVRYESLFQK